MFGDFFEIFWVGKVGWCVKKCKMIFKKNIFLVEDNELNVMVSFLG